MTPERFNLIRDVLLRRQPDLTVLADGLHKTHNVAAVVRSCDAVGVLDVHAVSSLGEIPRHHGTNAGTSRWTRLKMHTCAEDAMHQLRASGHQLLAAHVSADAHDYREIDYTTPTAIVLGTELDGISESVAELADQHIKIPMVGMVESLNVSVAAAIVLYEAQRQREKAGYYLADRRHALLPADEFESILFEWCHPHIARRCRELKRPYPALDEEGQMRSNPLSN